MVSFVRIGQCVFHAIMDQHPAFYGASCQDALNEFAVTDEDIERIMNTPQRTPEWMQARQWRLTGSKFASAADHNPYESPDDLVQQMLHNDFCGNVCTEWGTRHEPVACDTYEAFSRTKHADFTVHQYGLHVVKELPFIGVSPDGICTYWDDTAGKEVSFLLEIKCPYNWKRDRFYFGHVPLYYYDQIQGIMGFLHLPFCDFVVWTPAGMEVNRVNFDANYFHTLRQKLVDFYVNKFYPALCGRRAGELPQTHILPVLSVTL